MTKEDESVIVLHFNIRDMLMSLIDEDDINDD